MKILMGTRVVDSNAEWRALVVSSGQRIAIDVGCGDGRVPYERARADPASLQIGVDPDAETLSEYGFRASRKPARGGVANVLYVVASIEDLPAELLCLGHHISVNFPWGGLLRGLLAPQPATLAGVASLAHPGATFELTLTFEEEHDAAVFGALPAPILDETYINEVLIPAYSRSGINVESASTLGRDDALSIPSTWGRRLLHARPRSVFKLEGRFGPPAA